MRAKIVKPFTLKNGVERLVYNLNTKKHYEIFEDKAFYWLSRKRKIKIIEDNYRKVIVLLDKDGNDDMYYIFEAKKNPEEEKKSRQANALCNKIVKALDDGKYSNKALMNMILENGVSRLHNYPSYDFNLPALDSNTNYYEESDICSIDMNNAYAQVLFTHGLLDYEHFRLLVDSDKSIRLRVLGMLAKQQSIKVYENGKDTEFQHSYKTKYYGLFQWAEARVAKDMMFIKQILTDKFYVFHWVDGCYFKKNTPKKIIKEVENYLNGHIIPNVNYEYKFESVPYLKHYKEGRRYYLYLTKINKHGEPEPKLYSLSRAWLKEEAVEVL